jgi:hypothetical protein
MASDARHPILADTSSLIAVANTEQWNLLKDAINLTTTNVCKHELQNHVSKSSAYNYIDELVDAGHLVELAESQGASQYAATDWTLTIEIDGESLTLGPLTALVLANQTQYPAIEQVVTVHGLATLQACIAEALAYDRGETTTRQFAADTGLSYGLAFEALNAIAQLFGFESADEPVTSADAPDDPVIDSEVDLTELEESGQPSGEVDGDTAPIGLMERNQQSDETE